MSAKGESSMKVIQGGNQMSLIRDTEEVVKFLEFAGRKLILNEQAINCRLTACHNLFAVLNEEEDSIDYILSNLDVLVNRFRNSNNNVRASTLKVYKSRVKSSLEDFKAWSADPFAWERAVTDKTRATLSTETRKEKLTKTAPPKAQVSKRSKAAPAAEVEEGTEIVAPENGRRKVLFPIRPDFNVEVSIPANGLTRKELNRLGLFLYPYCNEIDAEDSPWTALGHPTH